MPRPTFSPFLRNVVLYSVCASSDKTQAFVILVFVTSIELERDWLPGSQLRRRRPRVGLWFNSPLEEPGRMVRGAEATRLLLRLLGCDGT